MNVELKIALIRRYGSQAGASKQLGIDEPRLSRIVREWVEPNERERQALEGGLGKAVVKKLLKPLPSPAPTPTDHQPAA